MDSDIVDVNEEPDAYIFPSDAMEMIEFSSGDVYNFTLEADSNEYSYECVVDFLQSASYITIEGDEEPVLDNDIYCELLEFFIKNMMEEFSLILQYISAEKVTGASSPFREFLLNSGFNKIIGWHFLDAEYGQNVLHSYTSESEINNLIKIYDIATPGIQKTIIQYLEWACGKQYSPPPE